MHYNWTRPCSYVTGNPMPPRILRTLVVEDNDFTRMTLCGALDAAGVDVVADAATAREALAAARELRPDAALLDLDLGDGPTGVDLAIALRRDFPGIGIVILTSYDDPRAAGVSASALPPGSTYLTKGEIGDAEALVIALARSIRLATTPGQSVQMPATRTRLEDLTDHQVETLRLVADGMSNAEIAKQQGVGDSAVERTIARLAHGLGIESSTATNRRVLLARAFLEMTGRV